MQQRPVQRGRPVGATSFDADLARAFGAAVRALRTERGIAQESLAHLAGIERSHMGKVERGEHMPTLAIVFKIARGLGCSAAEVMGRAEEVLGGGAAKSGCP
ncbi:MAG: helix-turn-helix domain-containing protein [Delftia acidovorans]|jgi:transcriptional regulator with XRE-family HTH domain|nr:helix-turn-helix domain-containing protein [Delftia acidovorans]